MAPDEKRLQAIELRLDNVESRLATHAQEVAVMTGHYSRLADTATALRAEVGMVARKLDIVLERLGGKP